MIKNKMEEPEMKLKRILSAAAAAAIAVSAFSVQASAAQKKLGLLTMPLSELSGNGISSLGDGLYCTFDESSHINGFISITDDDLANWRENGKLTWTEVKADGIDFSKHVDVSGRVAKYLDDNDKATNYLVYTFNGKDEVTVTYESDKWLYVRDDGNIVELGENAGSNTLSVSVISPEGDKNTADFTLDNVISYWNAAAINTGDNAAMVIHLESVKEVEDEYYGNYYDMVVSLDLVDINGSTKHIDSFASQSFAYYGAYCFGSSASLVKGETIKRFDVNTNEFTELYLAGEKTTERGVVYTLDAVNNYNKNMAVGTYLDRTHSGKNYATALVDLNDNGRVISDMYSYIGLDDSGINLVETLDGKWGYMNNDGELLKTFDDAGSFEGDYAPVVKDGKAFLIDRNLNRVSEKIKADGVSTIATDLYLIKLNGENYIATFAASEPAETEDTPDAVPADPETFDTTDVISENPESEDTADIIPEETETADITPEAPEASTTETTADNGEVKGSPDTGAAAVGVTAAAFVSAAGVLLLARKRK